MRVRTERTRSGDDGQTVCTVLAGTEGTVIGTKAVAHPHTPKGHERVLALTVVWDAALMNQDESSAVFVTDYWEEPDVLQDTVKFVALLPMDGEADRG